MAAKLLHSLADDNTDLVNIVPSARGLSHDRFSAVHSHLNKNGYDGESNNANNQHRDTEMNSNRSVAEKQRISSESFRRSLSFSCSSSLSSSDPSKADRPVTSSLDRAVFLETLSKNTFMNQTSSFLPPRRQCLDLRDVVIDSMYKEARGLTGKNTIKEGLANRSMRCNDSLSPSQLSKAVDGSKQNGLVDLTDSFKGLSKPREVSHGYIEGKDPHDESWCSLSKEDYRILYKGREINHLSFKSQETFRLRPLLKEQSSKLQLDSSEGSERGTSSEHRVTTVSKSSLNSGKLPKLLGSPKRHSTVVAKLMGLETMPSPVSATENRSLCIDTGSVEDGDMVLDALRGDYLHTPSQTSSSSQRRIFKESTSPRLRNHDIIMKPISSSRIAIEPAPWINGCPVSQKTEFKPVKHPMKASEPYPSIVNEIEKRMKDLEFKRSGKNLRALKHILEAMQVKGLLETKTDEHSLEVGTKENDELKCGDSSQDSEDQPSLQRNHVSPLSRKQDDSLKSYESPIVIIKPTKPVEEVSMLALSEAPLSRSLMNNATTKQQSSRNGHSDLSTSSTDKKTSSRSVRFTQSPTKTQQKPKESNTKNLVKNSEFTCPRLQQKKLELDKRSQLRTPLSESSQPRRQSNKQSTRSSFNGGDKRQIKSHNLERSDVKLSCMSNESRTLRQQGDDISTQSDNCSAMESEIDTEVTSIERPVKKLGLQSPPMKAAKYLVSGSMMKEPEPNSSEDGSFAEVTVIASEHLSPVSVLETSIYREDVTSPPTQIEHDSEGDDVPNSTENAIGNQWNLPDNFSNSTRSGVNSEIIRRKLQNIEHLVQKLRRLNSGHDEINTDYIALLCENTSPDHRYISEIFLASGLLLSDHGTGLETFQFHQSGYPINPDLFFVLERTKASALLSREAHNPGKVSQSKQNHEKFRRKLIFDVVNESLVEKLSLFSATAQPRPKCYKLAKKTVNAQKLLKELCLEMEQLETKKPDCNLEEESDGLKGVLWKDVINRWESWTYFSDDISRVVLDIERLMFKDLVNDVVIGEAATSRRKLGRRQLFAN